jgi:hypothetical protein
LKFFVANWGPEHAQRKKQAHLRTMERRAHVAEMHLRGIPQYEIAKECGVHPGQISRDIAYWLQELKETGLADTDAKRAIELEKINRLERTYRESWERSCGQKEITITKRKGSDANAELEATLRRESRDGNPRFLEGIRWCISKRCEMLGLDTAPDQPTPELDARIEKAIDKVKEQARAEGRTEALEARKKRCSHCKSESVA